MKGRKEYPGGTVPRDCGAGAGTRMAGNPLHPGHGLASVHPAAWQQWIHSRDGRAIARLRELLVDEKGRIQYGLLSCAVRDGRGEKLVPIPWQAFEQRSLAGGGLALTLQTVTDLLPRMRGYDPHYWPALQVVV